MNRKVLNGLTSRTVYFQERVSRGTFGLEIVCSYFNLGSSIIIYMTICVD